MDQTISTFPLYLFLSVSSVALFSFISVAVWADARQKEREAFYRSDMMKKVSEADGAGGAAVLQLFREQQRHQEIRKRESLRIGGLVLVAVGTGLMIFLRALSPSAAVYLCGLIPLLLGVALGVSSFLLLPKE